MPSPTVEKAQGPDGLIVGCVVIGAILLLAILSEAQLWAASLIIAATLIALGLYFRTVRPTTTSPAKLLSRQDMSQVRGDVMEELADAMPRAVAVLDRNAEVVHANLAAKNLLSADMVGRPLGAYLRNSSLREMVTRAFDGEDQPSLSVHVLQPTERYVDVDFSDPVAVSPDNEVVYAVIADRTEQTLAREQRADFLANASHELKTPIASLKGYIETLRGHAKDDPEAQETFLGIMGEQTERMERLVTDLLSLRRIESSEHIAPSKTADIKKAVKAARDALRPLAKSRNVKLKFDMPESKKAPTFGKTDECVQLFLNLMENAIKLSPEGSTVKVSIERLPNWAGEAFPPPIRKGAAFRRIVNRVPSDAPVWRVVISDSGPGFSRMHLPRIGERFYRVAGDLPAQEKGTGLGLAIVKHIVMRHRAGLFVQSVHTSEANDPENTLETGTSFSVVFTASDTPR